MKKTFKLFAACALMGAAIVYTGCTKDYAEDIKGLDDRLTAVEKSVSELQSQIKAGAVITDVTSTANGVKVTLSNGKTFEITNGKDGANGKDGVNGTNGTNGTNGKDGQDGKPGSVVTIGDNGNWWIDGKDTGKPSRGENGKDGVNGSNGTNGTNGTDGKDADQVYYKPGSNGCWIKVTVTPDGNVTEEQTTESFLPEGTITAVWENGALTLYGVENSPSGEPVVIDLAVKITSLAFIPEVTSTVVPYATTKDEFYHVLNYISEDKYDATTYEFKPQDMDASNSIKLPYRINPSNAYVDEATEWSFINRSVKTRAVAGDKNALVCLDHYEEEKVVVAEGTVTADVRYNVSAESADNNIIALQAKAGDAATTSDYIYVTSNAIDAKIANKEKTVVGTTLVEFANRKQAIVESNNEETDDFVKQYMLLSTPADFQVVYDDPKGLDLSTKVGLYSVTKGDYLTHLDFKNIEYKFSMPAEYKADDTQKTNQQWFATLEGSVIKVNTKNLENGLTPAIGRTPVVRVDAYMGDNEGKSHMIASAYIKVQFVASTPVTPDDKPTINASISADKSYEYHDLIDTYVKVGEMTYQDVNNKIYGATGTTSTSFWGYYAGNEDKYNVKLTTKDKTTGADKVLWTGEGECGTAFTYTNEGVQVEILLNATDVTTSNIKVGVNNDVKTENTYKDIAGKGAEYVLTITIPSDNKKVKGDVVLTQKFYVREDCTPFEYNPLAYVASYTDKDDATKSYKDAIIIIGQQTSDGWKMKGRVNDHFKRINNESIFTYYNNINNVTNLVFDPEGILPPAGVKVEGTGDDMLVRLDHEMTTKDEVYVMNYKTTLENGETCDFKYHIVFINPFVGSTVDGGQIDINSRSLVTLNVAKKVFVKDTKSKDIYKWNATSNKLELTNEATGTYVLDPSQVSVAYEFDTTSAGYKELSGNMGTGSTLECDSATGDVTWKNVGNEYQKDITIPVIATVTFDDLSIVTCTINVKFER